MIRNRYRVPGKMWRKWPESGRRVFNAVYAIISANQSLVGPPQQSAPMPAESWRTIAWNAACIAADVSAE